MYSEARRERARIRRKKQVAKRKMILLLATVMIITIGSIAFGSIFSAAQDDQDKTPRYKYYKSIIIEQGDSLWSIAEEYVTSDYSCTREYVDELKQLNGLHSEQIRAGEHLMIAYYDTEMK